MLPLGALGVTPLAKAPVALVELSVTVVTERQRLMVGRFLSQAPREGHVVRVRRRGSSAGVARLRADVVEIGLVFHRRTRLPYTRTVSMRSWSQTLPLGRRRPQARHLYIWARYRADRGAGNGSKCGHPETTQRPGFMPWTQDFT